ncbi:NUDIX domain-containing protein [Streptomyces sp. TLI_105]|uniref:NUDIX domain-containing protein n=1 Tax=Streptomyces sp. TLI_105 TaxID=1881019 RepID=UPI00089C525A|nr:NUDIX domain-containing protein [Streptomyces sp. TLI_105]SED43849.1 Isopentenyldiphosphate isomerase [Streptomyces sp. TLI_105]
MNAPAPDRRPSGAFPPDGRGPETRAAGRYAAEGCAAERHGSERHASEGYVSERVDYVDPRDRVVAQGGRAAGPPTGLLRRYAATVCTDHAGRVLLYRRTASAPAYPDHYDVLIGGAVRSGEEYRAAALRELREELGWEQAPGLTEAYRIRVDDPHGACFLTVHRWVVDRAPRPDPSEIAWCGFVAPLAVLTGGYTPLVPAGAEAVRRLFPG